MLRRLDVRLGAKLPDFILAKELNTGVYVINLSSNVALNSNVPNEFGLVRMFHIIILKFLGVKRSCIFLRMRGKSWVLKLGNVSLLNMVKMNSAIIFLSN